MKNLMISGSLRNLPIGQVGEPKIARFPLGTNLAIRGDV